MNGALGSFATLGTKTTLGTVAPLTTPKHEKHEKTVSMGDAAAQQQQKRAFFASFPPTGDKSMNVVSDVHHGSIRTVPLGKIEGGRDSQ